jgi:hypothetical protein
MPALAGFPKYNLNGVRDMAGRKGATPTSHLLAPKEKKNTNKQRNIRSIKSGINTKARQCSSTATFIFQFELI